MTALRTIAFGALALCACGDEASVPTSPFDFSGCDADDLRFVVLQGRGLCDAQSPAGEEAGPAQRVVADETWSDWQRTEPPRLRVPAQGGKTVVAYCLAPDAVVLEAACDDDADGALLLQFAPVCRRAACSECHLACPWPSLPWRGAAGEVCVQACAGCDDADDDGHVALQCGGDDCDDASGLVHPDAIDPESDCVDQDCAGDVEHDYDFDQDGFDAPCSARPGETHDCDDHDAGIRPDALDSLSVWRVDEVPARDDAEMLDARGAAVALDTEGHAHACYWAETQFGQGALYYTTDADGWSEPVVIGALATGDERCAIGVDAEGAVHIAYLSVATAFPHLTTGQLLYATNASGQWVADQVVAAVGTLLPPSFSMALDSDGRAHLAFPAVEGGLGYAVGGVVGFEVEVVDPVPPGAWLTSLAVDRDQQVHIAYRREPRESPLFYARGPQPWELDTIDESHHAGETGFSLGMGRRDRIYVAYTFDGPGLKLARRQLDDWSSETFDFEDGTTYVDPVLAVGANDELHVAYGRYPSGKLRYAMTLGECPWQTEDVGDTTRASAPWIALGRGTVVIAFISAVAGRETGDDLDLAQRGDGIDQNCDLRDGVDLDGDGFASVQSGGDDCGDDVAEIHPGAAQGVGFGDDFNCDCVPDN